MKQKNITLIALLLLVLTAVIVFFLKPADNLLTNTANPTTTQTTLADNHLAPLNNSPTPFITGLENLPKSLQGTEVDGELTIDAEGNLIVTKRVRDFFDYFLSTIGEENLTTITLRIEAYINKHLPAKAATQGLSLFHRYLAFKDALSKLQPNHGGQDPATVDISAIKNIKMQGKQLRQQFFNTKEAEAFFGTDDDYDTYSLSMLELERNTQLSTEQKAAEAATLFKNLPEQTQASMRPALQYQALTSLTEELKAKGGTAEDLHNLRVTLVGEAATQRLEALDSSRVAFQARIERYLKSRKDILNNNSLSPVQKKIAIQNLQNSQFDSQEQLRLPAFEQMAALGINPDQL